VRFPFEEEIPGDSRETLASVAKARITTGYVIRKAEGELFDTYIEANVHAPDVFEVFRMLVFALMPDLAAPLIGIKEDDPVLGPYTDRRRAISVFEPHVDLLQNDGFLEFGMIHQSEIAFEEIFVASPKYFKIWTNNAAAAEKILQSAGLPKCGSLEFIDEYPMVSSSVGDNDNAEWTGPFYAIQDEFAKLSELQD